MFRHVFRKMFDVPAPLYKCNFKHLSSEIKQIDGIEMSYNHVVLVGRTGNNPELRGTEEQPVVTFSMATSVNYIKNGELTQQTEWHRIAVFRPYLRKRVLSYMMKGIRVMVTGKISYFERKDPENANIIYKNASIIAEEIIFLSKASDLDRARAADLYKKDNVPVDLSMEEK